MRGLESQILDFCEGGQERSFLRLLRKGALRWSAVNEAKVELPRIPTAPYQYKNPFSQSVSARLKAYEEAKDMLAGWLECSPLCEPTAPSDQPSQLDVLVLSAILHGGLFSRPSIVALLRAIPEMASRTLIVDGKLHIELSLSWNGLANSELRRWQPDPLTAVLWTKTLETAAASFLAPEKLPSGEKAPSDSRVMKRFTQHFREILVRANRPGLEKSEAVIAASYVVAHIQMPPIIARYASREIISHSMSRATLARFTFAQFPRCEPPIATNRANNQIRGARTSRDRSDDPLWLRAVLKAIESPSAETELRKLRGESTELLTRTFATFALWLLSVTAPSGSNYTTKAATEMNGVLGRYLGPFLESINPTGTDAETMNEFYWQAMEATGPMTSNRTLKGDLSRALLQFDRFLSVHRQENPIARPKFPWFPTGLADVDANPVSHEQYKEILDRIEREWPTGARMREIAWLLVVLGFRCGLRRMEALYLQVEDVLVHGRGELLVRPTDLRKLKSENAERRLPLGLLLNERELARLKKWKEDRLKETGIGPTDCLFGIKEGRPVSEKIFNEINRIMRPAGEPNTSGEHFHELRKGFSTNLFLALTLADSDPIPALFPRLDVTTEWLSHAAEFRAAIFRHRHPSRKYAFLIARWLGHGSPSTSLENYIFVADYLLAAFLEASEIMRPDPKLVKAYSEMDDSTRGYQVSGGGLNAIAVRRWEIRTPGLMAKPKESKESPCLPENPEDWVGRIWEFLHGVTIRKDDLDSLGKEYGIGMSAVEGILERAEFLADQHLYESEYRHPMVEIKDYRTDAETKIRLNCPLRPRGYRSIPSKLAAGLRKMCRNQNLHKVLQDALMIYVDNVNREGYVQFADQRELDDVRRFVSFMSKIGASRSSLEFVSGASSIESDESKWWRRQLRVQVTPRPSGGHFLSKSAISIRPNAEWISKNSINHSKFRWLLVMAFVAFGSIPLPKEISR